MTYLQEESYLVDVTYDTFDDYVCYNTRYRFKEREIAEEFVKYIEENDISAMCSYISFEKKRSIANEIYRPRYNNIENAIEDLNDFMVYCDNIHYKNEYKYAGNVFQIERDEYDRIFLIRKYDKLEKDNKELDKKYKELEKENKELEKQNIEWGKKFKELEKRYEYFTLLDI
jgi:hypothetical protein